MQNPQQLVEARRDLDGEIKAEAFTFTRHGLLHGPVTSLNQDIVAPQEASNSATQGGRKNDDADVSEEKERQARRPTYVAHVARDALGVTTEDGYTPPLEPGMAVAAEAKKGRRRVMRYLFSPLSRFKQEGLKER